MFVACIQLSVLLVGSLWYFVVCASLVERRLHSHHDVVVLVGAYVCSYRETEWFATHDRANHLNREVSRALE